MFAKCYTPFKLLCMSAYEHLGFLQSSESSHAIHWMDRLLVVDSKLMVSSMESMVTSHATSANKCLHHFVLAPFIPLRFLCTHF